MSTSSDAARLRALDDAISAAESAIAAGETSRYPGLEEALGALRAVRVDVAAGTRRVDPSGLGRQVADQWSFSELGEKVLAAVAADEQE